MASGMTFDALLRDHGLRATPQRAIVIEALMALSHPDADSIFAYAQERQPSMSLATVYNVLDKLKAAGLVHMLELHGRRYFDVRLDHHDHVHCRKCGQLADVNRPSGTRLVAPRLASWHIEDQALIWEGLCPVCQQG
jgi:Fur family peroxide stress response transcriptional regulator